MFFENVYIFIKINLYIGKLYEEKKLVLYMSLYIEK